MRNTSIILLLITALSAKAEAQKGEKSIAAGLLVAFPVNHTVYSDYRTWNIGVGLEAIGQYNFTKKSAALLQLQLTRFTGYRYYYYDNNRYTHHSTSFISLSLKGGYRYQFTTTGFYANVLVGVEQGGRGYYNTSTALGVGKRFPVKDIYFIDAGLDYVSGNINRYNIKAVFSLRRRPKVN